MDNGYKLLFEIDTNHEKIVNVLISDRKVEILEKFLYVDQQMINFIFENGDKVSFQTFHSKDCCENVYADWEYFSSERVLNKRCGKISIKSIPGEGILLVFDNWYHPAKEFVPCYNEQNGYYSDELTLLVFKNDEQIAEIDLRESKCDLDNC